MERKARLNFRKNGNNRNTEVLIQLDLNCMFSSKVKVLGSIGEQLHLGCQQMQQVRLWAAAENGPWYYNSILGENYNVIVLVFFLCFFRCCNFDLFAVTGK